MKTIIACVVALSLFAIHCNNVNEVLDAQQPRVTLNVFNLPHLAQGEGHYEVWATFLEFSKTSSPQHESGFHSLGEFNVAVGDPTLYDRDGNPARFIIPSDQNAQLLDDVVITIDTSATSTADSIEGSILMGGLFRGDVNVAVADLDAHYADAFGSDFSGVSGKLTITAPTSPADSNSGVWFIEQQGATTVAGLRNLPVLPKGWRYEGWVGSPGGPVEVQYWSTGRFARADSADADGAGLGRGPGVGFNFPGQDFINSIPPGVPQRPHLPGFGFMVTVEPEPDNSPAPYSLRILATPLTHNLFPQGQPVSMNNVASSSLPRGRITVVRSGY